MEQFISRKELALRLGVSSLTVSLGIIDNEWPFNAYIKIGNTIKYPIELLEEIEEKSLEDKEQPKEKPKRKAKEKQPTIRYCKKCGKEVGKLKQYCEECRKIRAKEIYEKQAIKRGTKVIGKKKKRKEEGPVVRHCKRCGKEVGKSKQYCDECRKIRDKEVFQKSVNNPEVKEKRRKQQKLYYAQPEVKEWFRSYYLKNKGKDGANIRHCERCGKEVGERKRFCDECLVLNRKESSKNYHSRSEIKEKKNEYYREARNRKKI